MAVSKVYDTVCELYVNGELDGAYWRRSNALQAARRRVKSNEQFNKVRRNIGRPEEPAPVCVLKTFSTTLVSEETLSA